MADNVPITPGTGKTIGTDEVSDGVLGLVQVQFVKLMDGTLDSSNKLIINASGAASVAQATASNLNATVGNAAGASAVNIQDGGNSITVDGTVATTQSGTWTVQPGNTANTTPWLIQLRASDIATYAASETNISPAVTPTDVFTITGSATKTIKIRRIEFSGLQTTTGNISVLLIKRSTANTGGTSAALTSVPLDSTMAAATATCLSYTANPTLGTAVGTVLSGKVMIPSATSTGLSSRTLYLNLATPGPIVLRGVAQVLSINLAAVSLVGGSLSCTFEWTED